MQWGCSKGFYKNSQDLLFEIEIQTKVCAIVFVSMLQQSGCNGLSLYWLGRWLQHLIKHCNLLLGHFFGLSFSLRKFVSWTTWKSNFRHMEVTFQVVKGTSTTWKSLIKLSFFKKHYYFFWLCFMQGKGLGLDPSIFLTPFNPLALGDLKY